MLESNSAFANEATFLHKTLSRDLEFDEVVYRSLEPMCLTLTIIFIIFVTLGFIDPEAGDAWLPIVLTDALSVIFYFAGFLALDKGIAPRHLIYPMGIFIASIPLGNALLAFWLTENPFFLSYLPMIAIGCGAFMLSLPWMLMMFAIILAAVFIVGSDVLTVITVLRYLPALFGAFLVSILILIIRRFHVIDSQRALIAVRAESEERKRAESNLAHAQRLESIGKLVSGIAHDFNNLLTVIIGYTESLMLDNKDKPALHNDLQEIHSSGEKAAALAAKLLAFSRQQFLQPQVVRINELIESAKFLITRSLQSHVSLSIELDPDAGSVNVDPLQLEQVLVNLSLNARDAMAESGGELTISTRSIRAGSDQGDRVEICVKDTGCGMSEEVRARVFEPFYTTKEVGAGTGLGLAMVYGIVTQSGGTVTIDTAPGQGTTVRIELERLDSSPQLPLPTTTTGGAEGRLQNVRVLLVDDEEKVRDIVSRMLERQGCKVLIASSVNSALALTANEQFDVLLSDVVMPAHSGYELVEALRSKGYAQPALLMSGFNAEKADTIDKTKLPLLHKPFSAEDLAKALCRVLDIH